MMKIVAGIFITCFCLVLLTSLTSPTQPVVGVGPAKAYFKTQAEVFAGSTTKLQTAINALDKNKPATVLHAREALKTCRVNYKKIEFFLTYFFTSAALIYNGPPKYEIEEPFMEYQEPIGLQVIENLLFEKNPVAKKPDLLQQADAVNSSAKDLTALLYEFDANDQQLLESVRQELVRMITLGITGFDAPLLKSGIAEAEASLTAVQIILQPFLSMGARHSDSVSVYLAGSLSYLQQHSSFDNFDRLAFLKSYALPLQAQLGKLITELQLELNTTGGVLNYSADNIFSADALNIAAFNKTNISTDTLLVQLGKKLFFEPRLSGNAKISCATCHQPEKHFTDGLAKSLAFDGHSQVQRNASSLLYSGFQYEQFWDGRAKSLEAQVKTVINNPHEMNGGKAVLSLLNTKPEYATLFNAAFPQQEDSMTMMDKTAVVIAAFVRSLNPRNSRFDRYMQGEDSTLTTQEISGFNLFMGKAQCGTCHFAPLFNGLVPPLYNLSELEVLGTTKTDNLNKPEMDADSGRYAIFPMDFYDKAFKTPTVRNASATGPYMHNGSFKTLDAVVEFYNKGGGAGLGLKINNQTLSASPLNLSKKEVKDIVSFLHSLKDSVLTDIPVQLINGKKNNPIDHLNKNGR